MKHTFEVPVVFRVKAKTMDEAAQFVNRLQRYGFNGISECERSTWKAIKHWSFGKIWGFK